MTSLIAFVHDLFNCQFLLISKLIGLETMMYVVKNVQCVYFVQAIDWSSVDLWPDVGSSMFAVDCKPWLVTMCSSGWHHPYARLPERQ